MAMIGIIVGEFITGQEGLGYVIMFASSAGESAPLYAALLILATMGLGSIPACCSSKLPSSVGMARRSSVRGVCLMPLWGTLANCYPLRYSGRVLKALDNRGRRNCCAAFC